MSKAARGKIESKKVPILYIYLIYYDYIRCRAMACFADIKFEIVVDASCYEIIPAMF